MRLPTVSPGPSCVQTGGGPHASSVTTGSSTIGPFRQPRTLMAASPFTAGGDPEPDRHQSQHGDNDPLERTAAPVRIPASQELDPFPTDHSHDHQHQRGHRETGLSPEAAANGAGPSVHEFSK